jgi:CheY-like chemotaxis protein
MSIEPVPVDPLVRDVVELVQPLADTRGISITTAASSLAGRYVAADNQRLRQVLINLLSNAIKYNRPQGSVTVAVQQAGPDRSRISVSDTGAGLSPDQLTRLFVPFERLDANLSGIEGTGLGLALSRNLVTDMGGTLDVSSHVGVGSTFSVELHAVEPAAVAPDRAPESSQIVVRAYGTPKRVLYVEDMVANARLVAQILTRRPDVTLIPAMLGGIALELAREHVPDLVLLDLHLPDMEGLEVLRRLRADPHTDHIPVVILSADTTRAQTSALLEAGASRYLTKPIDVAGFLDVVDEVLVPLVSSAGSRRG